MKIEKTLSTFVLVDSDMKILPEVLDFTTTLEIKGFSQNTIKGYLEDLKSFYVWLELENLKFYEVKPASIIRFIEFVDKRHVLGRVSPATCNRYLATLSSFYRHFEAMGGFVEESPMIKVRSNIAKKNVGFLMHTTKKWDKNLHHYFRRKVKKKNDYKRLHSEAVELYYETINKLWGKNESLKFRNRLIFRVLYETGFRVSELLHLKISDYDYPDPIEKTGNIFLIERPNESLDRQLKTGERTVPVSRSLLQAIDNYVLYHRPHKENVEYIFVSHSKSNSGEAVGRKSIETLFTKIEKESEVEYFRLTPHTLRHTHASELGDLGVDISVIKERLGHGSINTTTIYTKPSIKTLIIAHERYLDTKRGELFD